MTNDVGHRVMLQMDGLAFDAVTLKKCDQAKTLADIKIHNVSVDKKFAIDPVVAFSRLLVLLQRSTATEMCFRYELCSYPVALFSPLGNVNEWSYEYT